MIKPILVSLVAFGTVVASAATSSIFESAEPVKANGQIDKLVLAKLHKMSYEPAQCSDAVFVRRAFLDVIGILPTAKEARDFINDPDAKTKRARLVDSLLERPEFGQYWAMKWGDILRIKAEFPVNLWPNAAQAYHRWVLESINQNKPYDKFARELLTSSGSNFRVGPVNFYRALQNRTAEGIATGVALTLMGTRADLWPTNQLAGMSVFFAQVGYKATREWKEEFVFWDPYHSSDTNNPYATNAVVQVFTPPPPTNSVPLEAVFPDGTKVRLTRDKDPREVFADWLISPKNPWFAKNIVNRVWSWLLGRGIIHEPDDIRADNPPVNPELLAYLEKELVKSHYDLKHIYRLILNSETYQFSARAQGDVAQAEANFGCYPLRRLDAEVLIDAVNSITGASDLYTSAIPEPFTYIPSDMPAVAIADGSITSPFLTLFGRSARATGMENERNNKPIPSQWLHLLNSSHIQKKLEFGPKMTTLLDPKRKPLEVAEELYLTILSRFPTSQEMTNVLSYGTMGIPKPTYSSSGKSGKSSSSKAAVPAAPQKPIVMKTRNDWLDIAWALINSEEFLYRH